MCLTLTTSTQCLDVGLAKVWGSTNSETHVFMRGEEGYLLWNTWIKPPRLFQEKEEEMHVYHIPTLYMPK